MRKTNQPIELIIQTPPSNLQSKSMPGDLSQKLKAVGIDVEIILNEGSTSAKKAKGLNIGETQNRNVLAKTKAMDTEINPWDMAYLSADAAGKSASYIEPNALNEFVADRKVDTPADKLNPKAFGSGRTNDDYDPDWHPDSNIIWHLGDKYSQLKSAREAVADNDYTVRIGHLDTGYSATHFAIPDSIRKNRLQRNFVAHENPNDAHDPFKEGFLKQPGHGTGTLGLLAGGKINIATANGQFNDYLGGAYFADVICCRISESVILFKTSAFADALNYLTELTLAGTQVHVVSMSMGGAPSKIWADAVNAAYEAGIFVATAAGNNFAGLPTRHVVYPARFGRVTAACGVTYDFEPYYTSKLDEMQGCYGPRRDMSKALSAFTPNTPWASVESGTIRFSGAGTSSATPQIAAAAAIYYKKYHAELDQLPPWKRVEAIRNALYLSALKKVPDQTYNKDFATYFGNGIIQVAEALKIPVASNLKKTPEDEMPWFPILNILFKAVPDAQQKTRLDMFNTELAQLVYYTPELRAIINGDKSDYNRIGTKKWMKFKDAVISHPSTSVTLRKYLTENK
jgi:subtilisin family serine protease